MVEQVYRARQPKASPLWQCLSRHFDAFLEGYEERYQSRYGFLRPIIPQVVNKFLDCGNRACASSRHARHRNRTNGSSNPATMTRSPACHGEERRANRRRDYDTEPVNLSSVALA